MDMADFLAEEMGVPNLINMVSIVIIMMKKMARMTISNHC